MIPTTYRGAPIAYATHDRKADTYALIGADGECIAELSAPAFFAIPNRTNLEVRSGRHRPTPTQDQRGADRKPGNAGRAPSIFDPFIAFDFAANPSAPTLATSARAGLRKITLGDIMAVQTRLNRRMTRSFLVGSYDPIFDEIKPPALKREGIVAGEIVGYRCWRVEHGMLRSVYQNDVWYPGRVLEGRELGDWDQRGIHAWKSARSKEYNSYLRSYLSRDNPYVLSAFLQDEIHADARPAMVTGTIFMWGDVVEHERGWRAEYARVRSLDWLYPDETMMGRERETLDQLRKLYGVAA